MWGWEAEETSADLWRFVLFPLPAWDLAAVLEGEQPHCDHKVTLKRKGPKEGLSVDGVRARASRNKEKRLTAFEPLTFGFPDPIPS